MRTIAPIAVLVLAVCLLFAGEAVGQQPLGPQPPTPTKADTPPTVMSYLALAILVAAAVGVNLIPSKRGHQD